MKNKKAIIIPFSIAAVSALLHLIFTLSSDFSDKFNATITLEELLKTINKGEFIKTMFNNNANFSKHSL
jgi:hypothetical protein